MNNNEDIKQAINTYEIPAVALVNNRRDALYITDLENANATPIHIANIHHHSGAYGGGVEATVRLNNKRARSPKVQSIDELIDWVDTQIFEAFC